MLIQEMFVAVLDQSFGDDTVVIEGQLVFIKHTLSLCDVG